jgi:SNF2-related domain/SNF2 Helicase protein/Helicase conserved C-terminal domain
VAVGTLDDVSAAAECAESPVSDVAHALVRAGRIAPALTVDTNGRARSWWWPLPAASQRALIANLVDDTSPAGQREIADQLAEAVDHLVRYRLVEASAQIDARRPGRPTVQEAWARCLVSTDPWLPASVDARKAAALAAAVQAWVRSGAVIGGKARLCLRVHEPAATESRQQKKPEWRVELLAQDRDEPSLVVPLNDLWAGRSPFSSVATEEIVAALGRMARLAPELAPALEEAVPVDVATDDRSVISLLRERCAHLEDAGIAVLLPAWWSRPAQIGLRARATRASTASGAVTAGGVGMDAIVTFEWQAALGGERLSKTDLASLSRAAEAKRSLVRVRGQWVEVDAGVIGELIGRVGRVEEAAAADLLRAGLGLDDLALPDGLEVVDVDARAVDWLQGLLDGALHATVESLPTPEAFEGKLRPYQERGAGWLVFLGRLGLGACLADDMGLGKTAQLIASVLADPADAPALVVCPVTVLGNWERELARFAPGLRVLVHHGPRRHDGKRSFRKRVGRYDMVLTTYSLLARDQEHLGSVRWSRLVFDEAQQIKNPSAGQSKAALRLQGDRRVALTGTPVENRLSELWSIMHVLNPGLLGPRRAFRERFAVPIERDRDPEATALLRRVTGPFILRRLKSDRSIITDLPDKIETVDRCPLTSEQVTLYQAVVDDLLARADESEGIERRGIVLAGLLKLKQVCNHPAHFLADGSPLRGRSGKLARTEELLEELLAEGEKVLCFTQFAAWGNLLRPYLRRRLDVDVSWLHGRVRRKARDEMVRRFADPDGPPVLLVSLRAGGTGLNLTAASHVIHLDRWWNPAVEDQATDRAYRIGQRRNVQVHKLVSTGTVEERIDQMITAKRELAAMVVGTGEEWLTELSTDELRSLVTLSHEAVGVGD